MSCEIQGEKEVEPQEHLRKQRLEQPWHTVSHLWVSWFFSFALSRQSSWQNLSCVLQVSPWKPLSFS